MSTARTSLALQADPTQRLDSAARPPEPRSPSALRRAVLRFVVANLILIGFAVAVAAVAG